MGKNFSLKMCKADRDILQKTCKNGAWQKIKIAVKNEFYKLLRVNTYATKTWLLCCLNYCLYHNKIYFSPSKYCAFCIDQMVKRPFKLILIPDVNTTQCGKSSRGILMYGRYDVHISY